jgi:Fe-S-cluster-containing dehydrogenase component
MSEKLWQKYYGKPNPIYGNKKQYGMLIDLNKCLGCHTCTMACKMTWTDEPGQENMYWNNVSTKPYGAYPKKHGADHPAKYEYDRPNLYQDTPKGKYPNLWQFYLPQPCNHCAQPACIPACPTKSIYKDENGVVKIDQNTCEGYQYCIKACPYGKIYFNPVQKKSQKCIMCFPLVEQGKEPQCVKSCVGKIRVFGDLMDPESAISKLIRDPDYGAKPYRPEMNFGGQHRVISSGERRQLRPDAGTIPSVWYIPPKNVPAEEIEKYFGFALQGVTEEPHEPEGIVKMGADKKTT